MAGFYGNITNTSKIQFVFDKTYQNRKQMEENMATDNIYIGRYVLVDYDLNFPGKDYARLYLKDNKFYFSSGFEENTRARSSDKPYYITETNENGEEIISINPEKLDEDSANQMMQNYMLFDGEPIYVWDEQKELEIFYTANYVKGSDYPSFEKIASPSDQVGSEGGFYHNNYLIDQNWWKEKSGETTIGRGWDSTVWQKVYTDNKEKYVMIAELNSVVPTFGIKVDPPTLNPMTPHFDADSSSLYYQLHVQPNWGFRVAKYDDLSEDEQKKYGSESYVENSGYKYDLDLKTLRQSVDRYDGVIYYNRKGFDPDYHREKPDKTDEISVKTTGHSGYEYTDHYGNVNSALQADIQELYINLPSVGNAVSDLYDVLYGTGTPVGEEDYSRRNKTVDWDSYSGERLVESNDEGTGYDFSPEKAASAAGAINSIHDLMGMIIINDEDDLEASQALDNQIYYKKNDGKFYIKDLTYDFEVLDENEPNSKTEVVELKDFDVNDYYYKRDNNFYYADSYSTGAQYIILNDVTEAYITDYDYKPNTYYTKTVTGSYALGKDEKPRNTPYYIVPKFDEQLTVAISNEKIENGTFFFPKGTGSDIYFDEFFKGEIPSDENEMQGTGLFKPVVEDGITKLVPYTYDNDATFISPLYWWEDYRATWDYEFGSGEPVLVYDQTTGSKISLNMIEFESGVYFYENKDTGVYEFAQYLSQVKADKKYYKLPSDKKFEQITGTINGKKYYFYEPDTYYYKELNNYLLAQDDLKVKDNYYNINNYTYTDSNVLFYEPNKYYYIDEDGKYILDSSSSFDSTKIYYRYYQDKYILTADEHYNQGEKCNPNVDYQDLNISIGFRKEKYEWKELKGFARSLNTIHGLILKINQILKSDDSLTRDTSTVQGCINQLNDIINKFDSLVPNQLLLVDQYGKIASGEAGGDSWINVITEDGKVGLQHIGPVGDESSVEKVDDTTPAFGSDFIISDYHFDEKGHKYVTTTHTVTIPAGSHNNNDNTLNGQIVITNLGFTSSNGQITTSSANLGDVYIANDETLNSRLATLQTNIDEEKTARESAIADLNMAKNESVTQFISSIIQEDGKVTVSRANAGTLVLGDGYSKSTSANEQAIDKDDSINTAFGKIESNLALKATQEEVNTKVSDFENFKTEVNSNLDKKLDKTDFESFKTENTEILNSKLDNSIKDNLVLKDTEFSYNISEDESQKLVLTIEGMLDYIVQLEQRIKALEGSSSGDDSSTDEPEPGTDDEII